MKFPESLEEMFLLCRDLSPLFRKEGEEIPQGLSLTMTDRAEFWRFREGNKRALLLRRYEDDHIRFEISEWD